MSAFSREVQTGFGVRLRRVGRFLYNIEDGTLLKRTPGSWFKIIMFYVCFYLFLALFLAFLFLVFYTTLDNNYPTQMGMDSPLKQNPGMGYRPIPSMVHFLIEFNHNNKDSYSKYVKDLEDYMNEYGKTQNGKVVDCSIVGLYTDNLSVCKVHEKSEFGFCTIANSFGYKEGNPCVLLKINKIINWMPVRSSNVDAEMDTENMYDMDSKPSLEEVNSYDEDDMDYNASLKERNRFDSDYNVTFVEGAGIGFITTTSSEDDKMTSLSSEDDKMTTPSTPAEEKFIPYGVPIHCEVTKNNKENASEVTVDYHPKLIRLQWFPFMNQPGYRTPIMFAKFNNLTLGVIYKVWCKLMAHNVKHHKNDRAGSAYFELLST